MILIQDLFLWLQTTVTSFTGKAAFRNKTSVLEDLSIGNLKKGYFPFSLPKQLGGSPAKKIWKANRRAEHVISIQIQLELL